MEYPAHECRTHLFCTEGSEDHSSFQRQRQRNTPEGFNILLSDDLPQFFCTGYSGRWYNLTITRTWLVYVLENYTNYFLLSGVYEAYLSLGSLHIPSTTAAMMNTLVLRIVFVKHFQGALELSIKSTSPAPRVLEYYSHQNHFSHKYHTTIFYKTSLPPCKSPTLPLSSLSRWAQLPTPSQRTILMPETYSLANTEE